MTATPSTRRERRELEARAASAVIVAPAVTAKALPRPATRPDRSKARRLRRRIGSASVMALAVGLIATMALPAYAFSTSGAFDPTSSAASLSLGEQSMNSSADQVADTVGRDDYTAPTKADVEVKARAAAQAAALKLATSGASFSGGAVVASSYPSVVAPEVQALATELMADVASGKLVGSRPDHIKEIQYLAEGRVVPDCGVDYRVLQTIKVAVDTFNKVGVSDINRACTGQIEGAGTVSPHYRNGGGHAVDFYILNGHSLTGGDPDSMKLLYILDPIAPPATNVGQSGCRASGAGFTNLLEFSDGCSHLHVDFITARAAAFTGDLP